MKTVKSTLKGEVRRTVPSTRVKLVRLDPIRSPIARCVLPRLTAARPVVSSGSEVPIATIFAPIRIEGTPNAIAMFEAELTVNWADITITVKLNKSVEITTPFFLLLVGFPLPFVITGGTLFFAIKYMLIRKLAMRIAPMIWLGISRI